MMSCVLETSLLTEKTGTIAGGGRVEDALILLFDEV